MVQLGLQLGADTVWTCDHVWLLGGTISVDLSLDRHVSVVSAASFYTGCVNCDAFVTSRVNYTASCCWPVHPRLWQTSCSKSWMLLRVLWASQGRLTADWHTYTSCWVGLARCGRSSHVWPTNSAWQCTSVCMAGRRIICLSYACRSLKWLNDSISVPPAATYTRRAQVPDGHIRSSCLHCGWADEVEVVLRWLWQSAMRATQSAWISLFHIEEATARYSCIHGYKSLLSPRVEVCLRVWWWRWSSRSYSLGQVIVN